MRIKNPQTTRGITLIEASIFIVLLSMLLGNMINYLYAIHLQDLKLMDEVQEAQKGFIATTAVVVLAMGTLAFLLATLSAVTLYADSVDRREVRIQKRLNEVACEQTLPLLVAKDYFLASDVELSDFGCVVHR